MQPQKQDQVPTSSGAVSLPGAIAGNRASRIFFAVGVVALVSTFGAMWAASHAIPIASFSMARSADTSARYSGAGQPVPRGRMPEVAGIPLRYMVALAHFDGDSNRQVENQVRRELEQLDTAFGIKIVSFETQRVVTVDKGGASDGARLHGWCGS
jgi:hypothetical protein